MTGFGVTPQAIEAAARANYEYDRDIREIRWQRGKWETLDATERGWYLPEAERSVAAAAPLLCQPLQEENQQLREAIDQVRNDLGVIAWRLQQDNRTGVNDPTYLGERLQQLNAALAAVPVGTGNPTAQREAKCCDQHHYSCALGEDGPPVRCCPNCVYGARR